MGRSRRHADDAMSCDSEAGSEERLKILGEVAVVAQYLIAGRGAM